MAEAIAVQRSFSVGEQPEPGWIRGADLLSPATGIFQGLLQAIGSGIGTKNKRVIAASFALRYGWSAGAPLQAYIAQHQVMNLALDNISLHFCDAGLYREYSLHRAEVVFQCESCNVADREVALHMAEQLYAQAEPVIEALHEWSRFSRRALWAMTVSSWASQSVRVAETVLGDRNKGYTIAEHLLSYNPNLYRNKPVFYSVQHGMEQRLFQKRAACCLYYLGPERSFCTSCPLLVDEERVKRSFRYMRQYGVEATSH